MIAKIPSRFYVKDNARIDEVISGVLRANGLHPGVRVEAGPFGIRIITNETTIPAAVRTQIKAAVLPLLEDTTSDVDLTV